MLIFIAYGIHAITLPSSYPTQKERINAKQTRQESRIKVAIAENTARSVLSQARQEAQISRHFSCCLPFAQCATGGTARRYELLRAE
jgi:hypothetical protein